MSKPPRTPALVRCVAIAAAFGTVAACAAQSELTRVDDRTYRVACKESLALCLVRVQEICRENGYDVVEGTEQRTHVGSSLPEGYESVNAKATVRCRQAVPLFGADPNLPPSASAPAPPPPVVASPPIVASPPAVAPSPVVPSAAPPPAAPGPVEPPGTAASAPAPSGTVLDGGVR